MQDYSQSGYHGKAVGGPSFTGSYISLSSASTQHVVLPQSFCDHVRSAASFSSTVWVYPTAVSSTTARCVLRGPLLHKCCGSHTVLCYRDITWWDDLFDTCQVSSWVRVWDLSLPDGLNTVSLALVRGTSPSPVGFGGIFNGVSFATPSIAYVAAGAWYARTQHACIIRICLCTLRGVNPYAFQA
jgi:hypothetical protein